MKKFSIFFAVAILSAFTCCKSSDPDGEGDDISVFEVDQSIRSAARCYLITSEEGDSVYLTLSTSMQWPVKLDEVNIKPLRKALLFHTYADSTMSVNAAMKAFISNTEELELTEGATAVEVDSVPSGDSSWTYFLSADASVMELTTSYITYNITSSSYLGGAHPLTGSYRFTYDFANECILTIDNMFIPGCKGFLVSTIRDALARQLMIDPSELDGVGYFTDQLTEPGQPYVQNGTVVFHYNPYEIAPYSMGDTDVVVYPYQIESVMTPQLRALLDCEL